MTLLYHKLSENFCGIFPEKCGYFSGNYGKNSAGNFPTYNTTHTHFNSHFLLVQSSDIPQVLLQLCSACTVLLTYLLTYLKRLLKCRVCGWKNNWLEYVYIVHLYRCTINNYVNECGPWSILGVQVAWLHIQMTNALHLEVSWDITD